MHTAMPHRLTCPPKDVKDELLFIIDQGLHFMEERKRDEARRLRDLLGRFWNCPDQMPEPALEKIVGYVAVIEGPPIDREMKTYAQVARFAIPLLDEVLGKEESTV